MNIVIQVSVPFPKIGFKRKSNIDVFFAFGCGLSY
jgi:hypothetical protein